MHRSRIRHVPATPRRVAVVLVLVAVGTAAFGSTALAGAAAGHAATQDDAGLELGEAEVRATQGGVAEFAVDVPEGYGGDDGEFGLVVSGAAGEERYELNASIPADATTVHLNTYAAGHSHRANVSDGDVVWAEDANGTELDATVHDETALDGLLAADVEYRVDLGENVSDAHGDPDATGSLFVEQRDPEAHSMTILRAPANGSLDGPRAIVEAREDGSLTETEVVVPDRNERLVLQVDVPGQEGLYRTTTGRNATAQLRALLRRDAVAIEIEQTDHTAAVQPLVVDVENSSSAVHAVTDGADGRAFVVVDLAASNVSRGECCGDAPLENGVEFEASYVVRDAHLLDGNGTAPLSGPVNDSGRHERLAAPFGTIAAETAFVQEPYAVLPVADAGVRGNTTVAPGTTGRIVLNATIAEHHYRHVQQVTVRRNGTFRATFDLRNATSGDVFDLTARGGLDASTVGEIARPPEPPNFQTTSNAPTEATVSEPVRLDVLIENTFGPGSTTYAITVDGEVVENGTLTLDGGESRQFVHEFEPDGPGEVQWSVALDGRTEERGTVTVVNDRSWEAPPDGSERIDPGGRDRGTSDDEGVLGRSRFGLVVAVAILVLGGGACVFWVIGGDPR